MVKCTRQDHHFVVKHLFKKPASFPFLRKMQIAHNYRGKLSYDPTNCNGCGLCAYCPFKAILVVNEGTKEERK